MAQVVADLGAVAVHRGQKDLAGTVFDQLDRVRHGIDAGGVAPAMGENFEGRIVVRMAALLGVDRHHDALAAEFLRRLAHEFGTADGFGVDRDLVGAGQ